MKRWMMPVIAAAVLAAGCGGPPNSDPKPVNVKEDPRIQRANSGPGGGPQQEQAEKPNR